MSSAPTPPRASCRRPDVSRRRYRRRPRRGVSRTVLLGAGIVALRDTAVALQWLHGTPWIDAVIDRIDGMSFAWWVIPAGVAALAVGAVLVISAVLSPSARPH